MSSEKELCEIFIAHVTELGFQVFPEYGDWDIVLKRNNIIIGVEAKLQKNIHLLSQLVQKENVNFKVALIPFKSYNLHEQEQDWILVARKLKIIPVMVFPDKKIEFFWGIKNLFFYRNHPKKLLQLPDFSYFVEAGVPSPRKVNQKNINFVKLEHRAIKNGGFISLSEAREFGFDRVPRWYYEYSFDKNRWELDRMKRASKDYPHIEKGIRESEK